MKAGDTIRVDFVVVGAGIAGLRAAVELGQAGTVLALAKSALTESATAYAQGGIAAALSDEDEIGLHEQDTLAAGDGLCNGAAVKILVEEGPPRIQELIAWGTEFDRAGTKLAFTREGAHSRSRVLHAHGDSTGQEIGRALFARVAKLSSVRLRAHAFTTALIVEDGRVVGLHFLDEETGAVHEVRAGAVLLATGGLGQVYRETTNPEVATGDGMAIAYEAGAALMDMEFVQFHPTALVVKGAPRFLLSEALRGEGGVLRNAHLERFMKRYHDDAELAPRDVVARAIVTEMHRTGAEFVYLDLTRMGEAFLKKRFPRIYATCQQYGLDIAEDVVPVRPAAHYAMGGVKTDLEGRTTIPGLYAAGETAATGVHGANRLASNSLLEGLVYGARAGLAMAREAKPKAKSQAANAAAKGRPGGGNPGHGDNPGHKSHNPGPKAHNPGNPHPPPLDPRWEDLRATMWRDVGILRDGVGLLSALKHLESLGVERPAAPDRAAHELWNVWTLGQLIARAALAREESRGSHYRSDYPIRDDEHFAKHSVVSSGKDVIFE
jgi:L-aspartate oxidase